MPKYDSQLNEVKNGLSSAQNVLIALPANLTTDKLAAGLSLMLSLKQAGKQVSVVSAGTPMVSHTNLFGIGDVKNTLPAGGNGGGDFVITLEGVVDASGNVPSEKLDWYAEGQNLNLVFHTAPGQVFQPRNISTKTQSSGGGSADWTFIIGSSNLGDLGGLNQPNSFGQVVNIDNSQNNVNFGRVNVVDLAAPSISEMILQIIQGLGLNIETDIASNILTGIYDSTNNLTQNVSPDTFAAASVAMQAGGKIPGTNPVMQPVSDSQPFTIQSAEQNAPYQPSPFITNTPNITYQPTPASTPQTDTAASQSPFLQQPAPSSNTNPLAQSPFLQPQTSNSQQSPFIQPQAINIQRSDENTQTSQPVNPNPTTIIPSTDQQYDLSKVFNAPVGPDVMEQKVNEPVAAQYNQAVQQDNQPQKQNEERPQGEFSGGHNPETSPAPDWLVPKIYKGGSVG